MGAVKNANLFTLRLEDAHEIQIKFSAPKILPSRKALPSLNSFSVPLRSSYSTHKQTIKIKKAGEWKGGE